MSVVDVVSLEQFDSLVKESDKPVLVDFAAESWCVPCVRLRPHFEAAAVAVEDVQFVRVDVDDLPELANRYAIMGVPTLLLFKGDEVVPVSARTAPALVRELSD